MMNDEYAKFGQFIIHHLSFIITLGFAYFDIIFIFTDAPTCYIFN